MAWKIDPLEFAFARILPVIGIGIGLFGFQIKDTATGFLILFASLFVVSTIAAVFYKLRQSTARLVVGPQKYNQALYESKESIVQKAHEFLIVTGSRARDHHYLKKIESCLSSNPELEHLRVLYGRGNNFSEELKVHLKKLLSIASDRKKSGATESRIRIYYLDLTKGDYIERFVCVSEKVGMIAIQSPNGLDEYDTGVLVASKSHCQKWASVLRGVKQLTGAVEIATDEDIERISKEKG